MLFPLCCLAGCSCAVGHFCRAECLAQFINFHFYCLSIAWICLLAGHFGREQGCTWRTAALSLFCSPACLYCGCDMQCTLCSTSLFNDLSLPCCVFAGPKGSVGRGGREGSHAYPSIHLRQLLHIIGDRTNPPAISPHLPLLRCRPSGAGGVAALRCCSFFFVLFLSFFHMAARVWISGVCMCSMCFIKTRLPAMQLTSRCLHSAGPPQSAL